MAVAGVKAYLKARPNIQVTLLRYVTVCDTILFAICAVLQSEDRSGWQASFPR